MADDVQAMGAGELLLAGPAVLWFATLAERAVHAQRANGVRNPVAERWLSVAIEGSSRVRASAIGRSEVPIESVSASSGLVDPVTTSEAAVMLNKTPRNVVDLCRREVLTTACKVGGQWQIERAEVLARAERIAS